MIHCRTSPKTRRAASFRTSFFRTCIRRLAWVVAAGLVLTPIASSPSYAATKIQHLVSPGGIEAWFVQDATVPLIAMEYAFSGGAAQDPADKPGVSNLVSGLLDEGSGDLDSKTFHERLERRAIELSFSSTRDYFHGSLRMLKDTRDEAFDLLRTSLTSPHFDSADVERIRAVTAEQVRAAAQKWLDKNRSVTGYLIKDIAPKREEKRS